MDFSLNEVQDVQDLQDLQDLQEVQLTVSDVSSNDVNYIIGSGVILNNTVASSLNADTNSYDIETGLNPNLNPQITTFNNYERLVQNIDNDSDSVDSYERAFDNENRAGGPVGVSTGIYGKHIRYRKLRYLDAEREINSQYSTVNHDYSSSLDVLASYLKGQKIIYMEAKYYCERNLN
jgi:hypothetical protein